MNRIEVEDICKEYRLGRIRDKHETLLAALAHAVKSPVENFKALKGLTRLEDDGGEVLKALDGVSFTVAEGEVVAVIGRNGAGKSTLLKILSRIVAPSAGRAVIRGRVASLLEVGTGFHPELTGRENVYMNGALLGMRRAEIDARFEEIVEFSGVARFIDTPVKRYSSGMTVRLAFSVAAHLEPEILLVDEVLAVGDAEFQKKCLGKMESVTKAGRTILFVSHNMAAVRALCPRAVLLDHGKVELDGPSADVIPRYLDRNLVQGGQVDREGMAERAQGVIKKEPTIRALGARLVDETGVVKPHFLSDEAVSVELDFEVFEQATNLQLNWFVVDEDNSPLMAACRQDDPDARYEFSPGRYRFRTTFPPTLFGGRKSWLSLHMINPKIEHLVFDKILPLDVEYRKPGQIDFGRQAFFHPRVAVSVEAL